MSRVVKEYDERYAEFLDKAQQLFYSKGYDHTSVQEIINAVGVAKGTFYHYFDSKADLLDALVKRSYKHIMATLEPMVSNESLNALEKFERLFADINNWKVANVELMLDMVHVFYQDKNVLLRTKMKAESTAMAVPLLANIIRQGQAEGTFDVDYPDEAAEIVLKMAGALSEAIASLLLDNKQNGEVIDPIKHKLVAYERSIERVLGAPENSIQLVDPDTLSVWFTQK